MRKPLVSERSSLTSGVSVPHRGLFLLTACQVRAARAVLSWTLQELSDQSGVSVSTLRRIEASCGFPKVTGENTQKLHLAFRGEGIEFEPYDPGDPERQRAGLHWSVLTAAQQQKLNHRKGPSKGHEPGGT